jgi:Spy/CpxP family protein refolding chaperone
MMANAVLFASVLLTFQLIAADNAKPTRRGPVDGANRPGAAVGAFEQILTDEQRREFREQMRASAGKTHSSQQELAKLRHELQEGVFNGKATEEFIKAKTEAIAKLDAEVLAARMNAMAKIVPSLTPEQKEKLKELTVQLRNARPGLGAGRRNAEGPPPPREPAAPPPPEK